MFQNIHFLSLLLISISLCSSGGLYAQAAGVIIISEKVGEMIDSEENEKYNLFPDIKGFQSAVFFKSSDGNYILVITYPYTDAATGEKKVERIPQTQSSIKSYRKIIGQFETKKINAKHLKSLAGSDYFWI